MKIILDERYSIEPFTWGFALHDRTKSTTRVNKKGIDVTDRGIIGYYASVTQAVASYLRLLLNDSLKEVTLQEYIAEYKKQIDRIENLLPTVKEK